MQNSLGKFLTTELITKVKDYLSCGQCQNKFVETSEEQPTVVFIDLRNRTKFICLECMNKHRILRSPPHLCLSLKTVKTYVEQGEVLRIDGVIEKQKEQSLGITFCGSTCMQCHRRIGMRNKHHLQVRCLKCSKGKEIWSVWCEGCFNGKSECIKDGHEVMVEFEPFAFWFEKKV